MQALTGWCHQAKLNYEEFTAQHSFSHPLGLLVPLACLLVCKAFLPSLTMRLWSVNDITLLPLISPAYAPDYSALLHLIVLMEDECHIDLSSKSMSASSGT